MDRKMELKRLLIYLAFAFGLTWAYFFLFILNGFRWDTQNELSTVVGLGMLFPFIANILTRWVTKEGFAMTGKDSLMLGISFKDRKWIFFLMAVLFPWLYTELGSVVCLIAVPEAFDPKYYQELDVSKLLAIIYPIAVITSTVMVSFAALGEEGGWRGYMMPKLRNLFGYKKAILIGGIIWGVWHAPLTCIGHNFGTDYYGFPYFGIALMCVMCTFTGMILTFITERSGSIWPAAFMHAVNNGSPTALGFFINGDIYQQKITNPIVGFILQLIPMFIIAAVCFVITCKQEKL